MAAWVCMVLAPFAVRRRQGLAECGLAAPADIRAKIEFEAKGDIKIEVHAANGMITTINVGQLIG